MEATNLALMISSFWLLESDNPTLPNIEIGGAHQMAEMEHGSQQPVKNLEFAVRDPHPHQDIDPAVVMDLYAQPQLRARKRAPAAFWVWSPSSPPAQEGGQWEIK
jgi:hypothetical protein